MPYSATGQWYPRGGVPIVTTPGGIPEDILATGGVRVRNGRVSYASGAMAFTPPTLDYAGAELYDGVALPAVAGAGSYIGGLPMWGAEAQALYGAPDETGLETFNGIAAGPAGVTPVALPAALAGLGALTLGLLRALWQKFGATIIKALVGAGAFAAVMKLIMGSGSDDQVVDIDKLKRRRRYTIGANPRVRTLQKVSRHCQRLLKRHEKVIREFLPKKQVRYGIPPSRALSAIERAAIKG